MTCVEEVGSDGSCEHFLNREMSQEDWDRLKDDLDWESKNEDFDLSLFLKQRGFSNVLRGITLAQEHFCYARLVNTHFIDCDLRNVNFSKGTLENLTFLNCDLEGALFFGVNADSLTFNQCNLSYTCWNQARVHDLRMNGWAENSIELLYIQEDSLEGMTFLGAHISGDSWIKNCSLKNIIFSGNQECFSFENCTPHEINRPIIGIGMNLFQPATYARIEALAIRQFGGIPLY